MAGKLPIGELDLVFATRRGHPHQQANIHRQVWAPLLHKCGLTNDSGEYRYNFHMLRHAAASLFIAYLKWPPKRIQTVMGHANVALTFDLLWPPVRGRGGRSRGHEEARGCRTRSLGVTQTRHTDGFTNKNNAGRRPQRPGGLKLV